APDAIGEYPATTCSATTNRKNTTPIPPYTTNVTRLTAVNSFDANTSSGTIASGLPVRVRLRSVSTKPAPHATPSAAATMTATRAAPGGGASVSAYVTPASASAASPAPSTPTPPCAVSSLVSGTCRTATATTTAASGRLIRNTQRQPAALTSQPPRN